MRDCEYVVIGQGLAGTLVCQALLDKGKNVIVIDNSHKGSSSKIAAGIVNPITGRRFVKSWMIEELMSFAEKRYAEFSQLLDSDKYFSKREILRCLFSPSEENDWLIRTAQPGWTEHVLEAEDMDEFQEHITPGIGQGVLLGAQVDLGRLIQEYKTYLLNKNLLVTSDLDYDDVDIREGSIASLGIRFENIIWCEGAKGRFNPFWDNVEFEPSKGEVFHLEIKGLKTERLLKHKMIMAPLDEEKFWFGANYEWNSKDDKPSATGAQFLQKRLDKMIPKYTKVDHLAAIRPTIKDRRPVIGRHETMKNCYIFNGLGTKGASIGPFFADHFVNYLLQGTPLLNEVNVQRYYNQKEIV